MSEHFFESVYEVVKKIPKGKVTTYGHIALLLGKPRAARVVGYALNALQKDLETSIPWQRVINAKGQISFKGEVLRANLQKKLLEKEKIVFNTKTEIVDFEVYGWFPGTK
ncbi:MAG: MGMT family protein [Leptospira sp.]|nr:MGMT family protein [Leptospira sp.]